MLIGWKDLGHPVEPGDYERDGMLIRVDRDVLSVWRAEPSALFHVLTQAPNAGVGVFLLGEFEVPDGGSEAGR